MIEETFTAYDVRAKLQDGASLEFAWNVGRALAEWLPTSGSIAIMRGEAADEHLYSAVVEGVRLQGRDVCDASDGDKGMLITLINQVGHSGGVLVGHDQLTQEVTIELYREDGQLIDSDHGLQEIETSMKAGNFVPAAIKGDLTALA